MTTWYTADLHFGHANILGHCNRPFPDADTMDLGLMQRWNEVVAPHDSVWVLGDVALSVRDLGPVRELNGTNFLVAGNHDACWGGHSRWHRNVETYYAAGFADVFTGGVVREHPLGGGLIVDLAHLPYVGDSQPRDRYVEHRPADFGRVLLCGHVHEAWKVCGRQVNVGVDVWDYRPVAEQTLRDLIVEQLLAPTAMQRENT